jgi:ABC-type bacteriocin/lantibiotic exporter with double-glycine peptidase domain
MTQQKFSTATQIGRLWRHLSPCRKRQLALLSLLMLITSFAEVVSISAVLPFLGVLTNPEQIFAHEVAKSAIQLFDIKSPKDLFLPYTLLFATAAIFAGFTRISLLWFQTRLSMAIGSDFSIQVFERTLYQPYSVHLSRNSSEILAGSQKAKELVYTIIQPVLVALSSFALLVAVIATLLWIKPIIALSAFLGFGIIYVGIAVITKRRIARNSQIIAVQQVRVTKSIQESLGGIRDVLIDGNQAMYSKLYREAFIPLQRAHASNDMVAGSPRFGVEALGMVLIAMLAYTLVVSGGAKVGLSETIPILGALALGAQRLLPVMQQLYNAHVTLKGNQTSTQDALDLLDQPISEHVYTKPAAPLPFQAAIRLDGVSFRYNQKGPWVLRNLSIEIPKGSRVGFVGKTGSGKSTLLDIIMGLLAPTEGVLRVDTETINLQNTRAWQSNIAHVPQSIFLTDASIIENIALGVPLERVDFQRVKEAAQLAQIAQTIESWVHGYQTMVGERGVRLSGGQRQRIGIARALYKQSKVIIFDEATSALDNETEAAVMRAIDSLGKKVTIFIIAHRLSTLENCDFVLEIDKNSISMVS